MALLVGCVVELDGAELGVLSHLVIYINLICKLYSQSQSVQWLDL